MERNSGWRSILNLGWFYELFQRMIGTRRASIWLAENHWRIERGMIVVDVGCGTASLRKYLPDGIEYIGFDPNKNYIARATEEAKGKFTVGSIQTFMRENPGLIGRIDVVLCSGVLHHLSNEEMKDVLNGAHRLLRRGGRFSALEPTWLVKQDLPSRLVLGQDRGTNIFFDYEWRKTLSSTFDIVDLRVANGLIRLPYTYALINAWKETGGECDAR